MAKKKTRIVRAPFAIVRLGATVIIRTVTHYYTGRVVAFDEGGILLEDAAWIADTGRWSEALVKGTLSEVEPYPAGVFVMWGAIIDVSPWQHALPREVV